MEKKKPNVILMLIDDLGIGDVSCFNQDGKIKTENIDSLAKEGMRFENSHSSSSLCTPSRYGLLTGRYNWRSSLKSSLLKGDSQTLIEHDRKTIAHLFKDEGYNTAAVGKWHLGMDWVYKEYPDFDAYELIPENYPDNIDKKYLFGRDNIFDPTYNTYTVEGIDIDYSKKIKFGPNQYGFDYFYGTAASLDQPPFVYIENDKATEIPYKVTGIPNLDRKTAKQPHYWQLGVIGDKYKHDECPNIMQEKVLDLINDYSESEDPFFIYYPCHLIHGPILPDKNAFGSSKIGSYGDIVLQLDRYIGEIISTLKNKGIFEDTVFVFTSDNGASGIADFPKLKKLGHNPSGIYRGHKMDIWEGGHREPTIVCYPKLIKKGSIAKQMICHTDFFATFAELLGVKLDDKTAEDSFSNLSIWNGENTEVRDSLISSSANGGFSIRTSEWKLNMVEDGGSDLRAKLFYYGPCELFKIKEDARELNNVINEYPEVVKELMSKLEEHIKNGRSSLGEKQKNDRNNPTGEWNSISWMKDYSDYIKPYLDSKD
ncbi:sulfatase family protein [Miniphocaeibacter massiliensis]|uniref:sulfatase family protein n=1 Tax=Miniphocaeibacter massiliensis TaxID=2041841 RepID=UPI000C1B82B9|nr:arylsulfatase [Miniphocaeibacter massiliensis]